MAGALTISTLNNDTGVLATQNGMTGIAKAWVNFNGSTNTINGAFNVGSITKNGTGDFTLNFTTAMPNANYSCFLQSTLYSASNGAVCSYIYGTNTGGATTQTTTQIRICTFSSNGGDVGYDMALTNAAIFGA
jgi:hypothetical protein